MGNNFTGIAIPGLEGDLITPTKKEFCRLGVVHMDGFMYDIKNRRMARNTLMSFRGYSYIIHTGRTSGDNYLAVSRSSELEQAVESWCRAELANYGTRNVAPINDTTLSAFTLNPNMMKTTETPIERLRPFLKDGTWVFPWCGKDGVSQQEDEPVVSSSIALEVAPTNIEAVKLWLKYRAPSLYNEIVSGKLTVPNTTSVLEEFKAKGVKPPSASVELDF